MDEFGKKSTSPIELKVLKSEFEKSDPTIRHSMVDISITHVEDGKGTELVEDIEPSPEHIQFLASTIKPIQILAIADVLINDYAVQLEKIQIPVELTLQDIKNLIDLINTRPNHYEYSQDVRDRADNLDSYVSNYIYFKFLNNLNAFEAERRDFSLSEVKTFIDEMPPLRLEDFIDIYIGFSSNNLDLLLDYLNSTFSISITRNTIQEYINSQLNRFINLDTPLGPIFITGSDLADETKLDNFGYRESIERFYEAIFNNDAAILSSSTKLLGEMRDVLRSINDSMSADNYPELELKRFSQPNLHVIGKLGFLITIPEYLIANDEPVWEEFPPENGIGVVMFSCVNRIQISESEYYDIAYYVTYSTDFYDPKTGICVDGTHIDYKRNEYAGEGKLYKELETKDQLAVNHRICSDLLLPHMRKNAGVFTEGLITRIIA